ncbi:hypothetical protein KKA14_07855, partial [bacterium]|nr:hypothetical protein [bacterium]
DLLIEFSTRWEIPLLVVSRTTHLAIRRKYEAILKFFNKNIMLFSTENSIATFASMADRYDFLKNEGAV